MVEIKIKKENISKAFLTEKKKEEEVFKKKMIMKEIELKTEKKIVVDLSTGKITNPIIEKSPTQQQHNQDVLQSILSDSAKEFKEKMGRNMTYSEMREMYG
jgi:hypothetical protein